MKKTLAVFYSLIIVTLMTVDVAAQEADTSLNGYKVFYFSGTQIKSSEGTLVDGKPDGFWKAYYENGKIKSEGYRKMGSIEGLWTFYAQEGQPIAIYNYKEGQKDSLQKEFYEDGTIKSEDMYAAGTRHGTAKYYSKTGILNKEVPFDNGRENGTGITFGDDGRIITITSYKNGYKIKEEKINRIDKFGMKQGVWKEYYSGLKVHFEMEYADDKLHGLYKEYREDGSIKKMTIYKDGLLVIDDKADVKLEIDRDYHNNGRVKSSVNLIDGKKQGVYREYARDGKITASKLYRDDQVVAEGLVDESMKYQGHWKLLYPDGTIRAEGDYKDGARDGLWTFYYKNGAIQQTGNYLNNKPNGEWKWYFMNNQLLREESYKKGREEGMMKEFDEAGNEISSGNYIEGRRDGEWKFQNSFYTEEGEYTEGQKTGKWKAYFDNGKTAFEGSYFDGNENGEHRYYYDTGKLKELRVYKMGIPDGDWKMYDITGELILTTSYLAGEVIKYDGAKIAPAK